MKVLLGECIGTFLLILFGNGAVANVLLRESKGRGSGWIVITAGWGVAVALAVYVCGWLSDAHVNPAVTLAFATIGKLSWQEVPMYLVGQFLGAFLGALAVYCTYYPHYRLEGDTALRRMTFCTEPAVDYPFWNFITEVIATFALVFSVLGIINVHNDLPIGFAPLLIGLAVFGIGISLGGPTGYAINPARDLAPRLAHSLLYSFRDSNWHYAWVPLCGPIVGGLLGSLLYRYLFM
ncbi:MAG: aquaporin family protein [Verrucomicrobia bacterium]|nr:aquaporin family protein [Verrucomicrobiota bacterium]